MKKTKRSNKWAFLLYKDSAPKNYIDILEEMKIPFILSPWHDKDVDKKTGKVLKPHKHGALFFDSLKSYNQVSELLTSKLNTPKKIEIIMSPKGMYDYFTHAQNKEKSPYNIKDIESGAGFDLELFLTEQNSEKLTIEVIDIIYRENFKEFEDLVLYARQHNILLLKLIMKRAYFFVKFLDSKRHRPPKDISKIITIEKNNKTKEK